MWLTSFVVTGALKSTNMFNSLRTSDTISEHTFETLPMLDAVLIIT